MSLAQYKNDSEDHFSVWLGVKKRFLLKVTHISKKYSCGTWKTRFHSEMSFTESNIV